MIKRFIELGVICITTILSCTSAPTSPFSNRANHLPLVVNTNDEHYAVQNISLDDALRKLIRLSRTAELEECFLYDPQQKILFETGINSRVCGLTEFSYGCTPDPNFVMQDPYVDIHIHTLAQWRHALTLGVPRQTFVDFAFPTVDDLLKYRLLNSKMRHMIASPLGITEIRSDWNFSKESTRTSGELLTRMINMLVRLDVGIPDAFTSVNTPAQYNERLQQAYDVYSRRIEEKLEDMNLGDYVNKQLRHLHKQVDELKQAVSSNQFPDIDFVFTPVEHHDPTQDHETVYHANQKLVPDVLYALLHD